MKSLKLDKAFEFACRFYVFIFLNIYGTGKILGQQFYRQGSLPPEVAETTLGQAGAFELAWTFMGYSFYYILFIGVSQLIGAWMLLFERTKLLGVAILIPILANIIVFDIIFLDAFGALASAIIYFSMLLYILFYNREKIVTVLKTLTGVSPEKQRALKSKFYTIAVAIVIMAVIFVLDQTFVNLLGHGKG